MRLLIAGNIANTGFYLTSKLREKGITADLFIEKNPNPASDPKNTGKILDVEYPEWIKFWERGKNWKRNLISTMRKYDLISAATELPIFAQFSLKPYVAVATGSDLSLLAQSNSFKGRLLRSGYRRAKVVVYNLPTHVKPVKKLKLNKSIFLPLYRDYPDYESQGSSNNEKKKFVFFHPTSQRWKIKKNDLFLKAFVSLCKSYDNVFLFLINRGEDADKANDLLLKAGINDKFKIIPKTLSQNDMLKYYNESDAVVDQFGVGAFGFTGLEVLNIGKPFVCYIQKDVYDSLYGEAPPVLSSNTEDGIYQILQDLVERKELLDNLSDKSHRWMQKFHSSEVLISKYIKLYEMVYNGKKFQEINEEINFNI